jgi:hypothetical protein
LHVFALKGCLVKTLNLRGGIPNVRAITSK